LLILFLLSPLKAHEVRFLCNPLRWFVVVRNVPPANGIDCSISEKSPQCTVSIRFKNDSEHLGGYLAVREWTLKEAQAFADETVRNSGHCCTSACGKWFLTVA
jgi:hypothetical protein